jgi:prepilin signal peptidase PulO-like enzyme (type II secretory pathway)
MYPTISFACAAGFGFWAGGLMNLLSSRLSPPGTGESLAAMPVRILAALVFGLMLLSVDYSWEWFIALPFAAALVTISLCDVRHMIIPDIVTIPVIVLVAGLRLWIHPLPYWDYAAAALVGSGLFYLVAFLIRATAKSESIGGGDIKLLALTGLVLGIKLTVFSFLMFCFAGTIIGLLLVFTGRYRNDLIVPFGPFIATASIISYFWGNDLIGWAISKLIL